ncbi:MAG TPA: lysylphosphatidylglycerol synthase transmembrane domain-containing protein [Thermoanaerobaculia bacterium]|nr:lysylphosphatidylglycerol synthase transmembrane domain-containing protein [Thermoanaerobaculia bacterium]
MKRFLQVTATLLLTAFLLWLFLKNADLGDVWQILKTTHAGWLLAGVVVNIVALFLRTIRWRTILSPHSPPPFYPTFFANTVGYMLSTVLPIRAADVARPALLARRTGLRFSGALGSVLTERVVDLAAILGLFVYYALRRWNEYANNPETSTLWSYMMKPATIISASILLGLILFLVGLYFFSGTVRRLHEFLGRALPRRFRDSWMHFFDTFVETLDRAKDRRAMLTILSCTVGIWACLTAQLVCGAIALDLELPFDASFFITGATTIGLAVPTPGGIGGMHKICQFILMRFYAMDVDASVAAAVLFHLIGSIPVVVVGVLLIAHHGLRWRDVTSADGEDANTTAL